MQEPFTSEIIDNKTPPQNTFTNIKVNADEYISNTQDRIVKKNYLISVLLGIVIIILIILVIYFNIQNADLKNQILNKLISKSSTQSTYTNTYTTSQTSSSSNTSLTSNSSSTNSLSGNSGTNLLNLIYQTNSQILGVSDEMILQDNEKYLPSDIDTAPSL